MADDGSTREWKGRVKEARGALSGDEETKREGRREQREGKLEEAKESLKEAAESARDAARK